MWGLHALSASGAQPDTALEFRVGPCHPVRLASSDCGTFPSLLALDWNRGQSCSVTTHSTADASLCAASVVLSLHLLESLPTAQTFSGVVFSLFALSVSPRLPFYLKCPHFTGPLKTSPARLLSALKILLVLTSTDTGAEVEGCDCSSL